MALQTLGNNPQTVSPVTLSLAPQSGYTGGSKRKPLSIDTPEGTQVVNEENAKGIVTGHFSSSVAIYWEEGYSTVFDWECDRDDIKKMSVVDDNLVTRIGLASIKTLAEREMKLYEEIEQNRRHLSEAIKRRQKAVDAIAFVLDDDEVQRELIEKLEISPVSVNNLDEAKYKKQIQELEADKSALLDRAGNIKRLEAVNVQLSVHGQELQSRLDVAIAQLEKLKQTEDSWRPEQFGEVPHVVEDGGQLNVDVVAPEPPLPEDYPTVEEFNNAYAKWEESTDDEDELAQFADPDQIYEDTKVRPFSNGSEYVDWTASNCDHCKCAENCDIEAALGLASVGDGRVSSYIYKRMGQSNRCGEYEADFIIEVGDAVEDSRGCYGTVMQTSRSGELHIKNNMGLVTCELSEVKFIDRPVGDASELVKELHGEVDVVGRATGFANSIQRVNQSITWMQIRDACSLTEQGLRVILSHDGRKAQRKVIENLPHLIAEYMCKYGEYDFKWLPEDVAGQVKEILPKFVFKPGEKVKYEDQTATVIEQQSIDWVALKLPNGKNETALVSEVHHA